MPGNPVEQRTMDQQRMAAQYAQLRAGEGDKKPPGKVRRLGQKALRYVPFTGTRREHKNEKKRTDAKADEEGRLLARQEAEERQKSTQAEKPGAEAVISHAKGKRAMAGAENMEDFDRALREALRRGQKKGTTEDTTSDMAILETLTRPEFVNAVAGCRAHTPLEDLSDDYEESMQTVRERLVQKLATRQISDLSKQELDIIYSTAFGFKYNEDRNQRNKRLERNGSPPLKKESEGEKAEGEARGEQQQYDLFWGPDAWPKRNGPTPPEALFRFIENVAKRLRPESKATFISGVLLGLKEYGRDQETDIPEAQKEVADSLADPEIISDYVRKKTDEPIENTVREFRRLFYELLTTPKGQVHQELGVPGLGYPPLKLTPLYVALENAFDEQRANAQLIQNIQARKQELQGEKKALLERAQGLLPIAKNQEKPAKAMRAREELKQIQVAVGEKDREMAKVSEDEATATQFLAQAVAAAGEAQKAIAAELPEYKNVLIEGEKRTAAAEATAAKDAAAAAFQTAQAEVDAATGANEGAKAAAEARKNELVELETQGKEAVAAAKLCAGELKNARELAEQKNGEQDGTPEKAADLALAQELVSQKEHELADLKNRITGLETQYAEKNAEAEAAEKLAVQTEKALNAAQAALGKKKAGLETAAANEETAHKEYADTREAARNAKQLLESCVAEEAKASDQAKFYEDGFREMLYGQGVSANIRDLPDAFKVDFTNSEVKGIVDRVNALILERKPLENAFANPDGGTPAATPRAPEDMETVLLRAMLEKKTGKKVEEQPEANPQRARERALLEPKRQIYEKKVQMLADDIENAANKGTLPPEAKEPLMKVIEALKDYGMDAGGMSNVLLAREDLEKVPEGPLNYKPMKKVVETAIKNLTTKELERMDKEHTHDEITHQDWVMVSVLVGAADKVETERFVTKRPMKGWKKWLRYQFVPPTVGLINAALTLYRMSGLRSVFGHPGWAHQYKPKWKDLPPGYFSKKRRWRMTYDTDRRGVKQLNQPSSRGVYMGALRLATIFFGAAFLTMPVIRSTFMRWPWEWFRAPPSGWSAVLPWNWGTERGIFEIINPPAGAGTLERAPTFQPITGKHWPWEMKFWFADGRSQLGGDWWRLWEYDWSGTRDPRPDKISKYSFNDNSAIPERLALRVDPESPYYGGEDYFTRNYGVGHRRQNEADDSRAEARQAWLVDHPEVLQFLDERARVLFRQGEYRINSRWDMLTQMARDATMHHLDRAPEGWQLLSETDPSVKTPDGKAVCTPVDGGKSIRCNPLVLRFEDIRDGWRLDTRKTDEFVHELMTLEAAGTTVNYDYIASRLQEWKDKGYLVKIVDGVFMGWAGLENPEHARFLAAQPQATFMLDPLLHRGGMVWHLNPGRRDEFMGLWLGNARAAKPDIDLLIDTVPEDELRAAYVETMAPFVKEWAKLEDLDNARFLLMQPGAAIALAPYVSLGASSRYVSDDYRDELIQLWRDKMKSMLPENADLLSAPLPAEQMWVMASGFVHAVNESSAQGKLEDSTQEYQRRQMVAGEQARPAAMLEDCTAEYLRLKLMGDIDTIRNEMGVPQLSGRAIEMLAANDTVLTFLKEFAKPPNTAYVLVGERFDEFLDHLVAVAGADSANAEANLGRYNPFSTPQGERVPWALAQGYIKPGDTPAVQAPAAEEAAPSEGAPVEVAGPSLLPENFVDFMNQRFGEEGVYRTAGAISGQVGDGRRFPTWEAALEFVYGKINEMCAKAKAGDQEAVGDLAAFGMTIATDEAGQQTINFEAPRGRSARAANAEMQRVIAEEILGTPRPAPNRGE